MLFRSTGTLMLQVGNSGGIVATGYVGTVGAFSSSSTSSVIASGTAGFWLTTAGASAATSSYNGLATLMRVNDAGTNWSLTGDITYTTAGSSAYFAGSVTGLSSILTTVRITTTAGTDTFDAGTINIIYE